MQKNIVHEVNGIWNAVNDNDSGCIDNICVAEVLYSLIVIVIVIDGYLIFI